MVARHPAEMVGDLRPSINRVAEGHSDIVGQENGGLLAADDLGHAKQLFQGNRLPVPAANIQSVVLV